MRWVLALAALIALVTSSACTAPCDLRRFDDAPGAGPGEARYAVAVGDLSDFVATSGGAACLSCDTVFFLDGTLRPKRRLVLDLDGDGRIAVSGDTTIVLDQDYPDSDIFGDDYRPPHFEMFALSADGDEQWRRDFGDGQGWTGNFPPVSLSGPRRTIPLVTAGAHVAVVYGSPLASVFDAGSGRLWWATLTGQRFAVAADAGEGLFIADGSGEGVPTQAQLRHLTYDGVTAWTTTWRPGPMQFGEITFRGAVAIANDGLLVAGDFTTPTLDLGGHVLDAPTGPIGPNGAGFVAALDEHGATRWAVRVGTRDATRGYVQIRQVAASRDGAVVCGEYAGESQLGLPATDRINLFVARVDATGAIAAAPILGESVFCYGVAAADDGSAIVEVQASGAGSTAIRVGSRTFDHGENPTYYVLNMML